MTLEYMVIAFVATAYVLGVLTGIFIIGEHKIITEFSSGCHPHDHYHADFTSEENNAILQHTANGYNSTYVKDIDSNGITYHLYHMSC